MDMSTAAMQKISVVDHINGFQYTPERSTEEDNFVIDMEDLSHNRESYPSSRITLQRSLSRKGLIRGGMEKKAVESVVAAEAVSSPRGASLLGSSSTPEKGNATMDHHHQQGNHQIAITSVAGSIKATSTVDQGRCTTRRNSFKRCQAHWLLNPRKVVIFFAALSSMGTLLLIFFTLSIGRLQSDEAAAAASAALE